MKDAELSPSDRIFVDILYSTGLRCGEALALHGLILILSRKQSTSTRPLSLMRLEGRASKTQNQKTASGRCRSRQALRVAGKLRSVLHQRTLLFAMQGGKMVSKSSYRRKWERIIKEMNRVAEKPVCGLTAHIFRHNYCTSLCYQIPRISIKNIASLLGMTKQWF